MDLPILSDIVIILGLSIPIILLFHRIKLPPILGFLLTGIIVGPHGLNLIKAVHEVEILSEIGIIFLLFVIGIEFSLKGMATIRNTVLIGGSIQMLGTIGLVMVASHYMGLSWPAATFLGFIFSLSSTAIVLKMLQEKGEINSPHGRVALGILIFQDIMVVVLMLLTPILAGQSEDPLNEIMWLVIKMVGIVLAVIVLSRYIVPVVLGRVMRAKSKELFMLTTVVLCFATAWLTSAFGLSLALGAFFAGLIISESVYSHQATANILPFREIFMSFFFVSVGMLLDFNFFLSHIGTIHLAVIGVVLIKVIVIAFAVYVLKYPPRTIILTALALFQVGEFSFLLSTVGMQYNLLSQEVYQYFLSVSIITMGVTPFAINFSPQISMFFIRLPMPAPVRKRFEELTKKRFVAAKREEANYHDHLVIIGFGMNGENVAKAARRAEIPYVIVELDPEVLARAKKNDEPIVYGDATSDIILKHVHVHEARVVVVAISSHDATRKIVQAVRDFTETAYVIVRTRYVREVEEIIKLGADEVIPEEFETSIEIFTRVLKKYLLPNDQIAGFINEIRAGNYEMLRGLPTLDGSRTVLRVPEMEIAVLPVQQGRNKIIGRPLKSLGLREEFNISVMAIKRGEVYITVIKGEEVILQDDLLYIFGKPADILQFNKFCAMNAA